jgi:hypothetical protein
LFRPIELPASNLQTEQPLIRNTLLLHGLPPNSE